MTETLQMPALAADGLEFDAPTPWSVVPVTIEETGLQVWHLVDRNDLTLISSTGVNGRGPELQRRMLERIASCVNATSPTVEGLARAVVTFDERGDSWKPKRHAASALLAQAVLGVKEVR